MRKAEKFWQLFGNFLKKIATFWQLLDTFIGNFFGIHRQLVAKPTAYQQQRLTQFQDDTELALKNIKRITSKSY